MLKHRALPAAGLALALAYAGAGLAAEPPSLEPVVGLAILHWTQPAAPPSNDGQDASNVVLADLSGRGAENTSVAMTEQSLSAVNTGNTINAGSLISGSISLQDSALSGFSGIGNIMMNTGANNNLQSTMSVTIIVTP
jgi:hypothetical protein